MKKQDHWSRVDLIIDGARDELMRQEPEIRSSSVQSAIAVILAERLSRVVEIHLLHGRTYRGANNWCGECGQTVTHPAACATTRLCFGEEP